MQYPSKFQRDPTYMMQQQQQPMMPQTIDEQIYREQSLPQNWPLQQPQLQSPIQQLQKQSNSIWPEKLPHQLDAKITTHKKMQQKDSEYSDEYVEGDEGQSEDVTTTEAPKKVKLIQPNK